MDRNQKNQIVKSLVEHLELPDSVYEKAISRYGDIGEWLGRDESICEKHRPHIFPQGSFRLGTAIRPLDEKEEYDLDLACKLQDGILKESHTQEKLKILVGVELEKYQVARGIKKPIIQKHRCWRLEYQDDLSFHIDIVPCIQADDLSRRYIFDSMSRVVESQSIAGLVSQLTVSITDDRHHGYRKICQDWPISNPEGYAKWFEERMNQARQLIIDKAQIEEIPLYKRKTPLQRSIQLLKRHRDQMFKNDPDVKPISIIITTLAAKAYQGESDIESALQNILSRMGGFVSPSSPRIPNPVNPNEDFADRWGMPEYKHLNLEQNFKNWLLQAQDDFNLLGSSDDMRFVTDQAEQKFCVRMNESGLREQLGLAQASVSVITPKAHIVSESVPKPHRK